MTPNAPLDGSLPDEDEGLGLITPEALSEVPVVRQYVLSRSGQKFSVIQYSDDEETNETIDYFLNYCKDMGWKVEPKCLTA